MNMKRYIKSFLLAAFTAGALVSCQKESGEAPKGAGEPLVICPALTDTRAINYGVAEYFGLPGYENATVTVDGVNAPYTFTAGQLSAAAGNDPFYFPLDGTPLGSVTVQWPETSLRGTGVATDQSAMEDFLSSDWLSFERLNVVPTTQLPAHLTHENAKIAFTLSNGARIQSLTLAGYSAYCDPGANDAQLILEPENVAANVPIKATDAGVLQIDGEPLTRDFTIGEFPTQLEAGKHYTITLTVQ